MKWQISKLIKELAKEVKIDEEVDFADVARQNPDIKKMSKVLVTGKGFFYPTIHTMKFDLKIKAQLTLSCALTLDDVIYPLEETLNPIFTWDQERHDPNSEDYYYVRDTIELAPIIWQEIFIQIPLRVVKDGAYDELARQGIEIFSEEDLENEEKTYIDPRFSVLEGLKFEENT